MKSQLTFVVDVFDDSFTLRLFEFRCGCMKCDFRAVRCLREQPHHAVADFSRRMRVLPAQLSRLLLSIARGYCSICTEGPSLASSSGLLLCRHAPEGQFTIFDSVLDLCFDLLRRPHLRIWASQQNG